MEIHVDLQRRFLAMEGSKDPETVAFNSYIASQLSGKEAGIGWSDILAANESVVILGEPGSGKTEEMRAQTEALRRKGGSAVFIELGQVVNAPTPPLSHDDQPVLGRWRGGRAEAWIFLDAVDESKLIRASDFRAALKHVAVWVGPQRERTHYVISSRISEWQFGTDEAWVEHELLASTQRGFQRQLEQSSMSGTGPVRTRGSRTTSARASISGVAEPNDRKTRLKVLKLLPLTRDQLLEFLKTFDGDPRPFLDAIEAIDALEFVGRPADARDLYTLWQQKGTLGTKFEMLEQSASIKLRLRDDRSGIAYSKLREGVEAVSASLHLSRRLTVSVRDERNGELVESIPLRSCLPEDWSDAERRSLIQRAIFDGATFGRVRLHHRTHQDYLAACWLRVLMEAECPYSQLRQLVFAEHRHGGLILRPFMASVAAWLVSIVSTSSRWVESFMADLQCHAPWIFLAHGDPQSLPIRYRLTILRSIVERFRGRDYVRIPWDPSTLKRFAHPDLAGDLATWIADRSTSADIRADYIGLVRFGNLHAAMDPVVAIATDHSTEEYLRATALICVAHAGMAKHRKAVLEAARADSRIPLRVTGWVAMCIYPSVADENELFSILAKISTTPATFSVSSLDHFEKEVVSSPSDVTRSRAECFLRALVDFLRDTGGGCRKDRSWAADWLEPSIARLLRHATLGPNESTLVIESIELLSSAREARLTREWRSNKNGSLNELSLQHPELRRSWYWRRYQDYFQEHQEEPTRLFQIGEYYDPITPHGNDRQWWFDEALTKVGAEGEFALRAGLWIPKNPKETGRGWPPFGVLAVALRDRSLRSIIGSTLISDWSVPWHRLKQNWDWHWSRSHYWKRKFDPLRGLYWHAVNKLHFLLKLRMIASGGWWNACYHVIERARHLAEDRSTSRWGGLDAVDINRPYGVLVGKAVRAGIDNHWRSYAPLLPHEKPERNQTSAMTVLGLVALDVAWSVKGDTYFAGLSEEEASRATRYALDELNGVPDWLANLSACHTSGVQRVFNEAIQGEWHSTAADAQFGSDTLGRIEWNDTDLPRVAIPIVRSLLLESPPRNLLVLTQALRVVVKHDADVGRWLAPLARIRAGAGTLNDQMSWAWLTVLMQLDADAAFEILERWVSGCSAEIISETGIRLCGALADRRQRGISMVEPNYLRPAFLVRFIPWIFRHVKPENDPVHEGAYSPTAHDDAAHFRSQLIEALVTSNSDNAEEVLLQLAAMPELVGQRDWLIAGIERRRERLADNLRLQPGDVFELRKQHERPARTRADLFQIARNRIHAFKDLVERSENSIRREVVSSWKEKDYQFWIKRHLNLMSQGRYVLPAEAEIDPVKYPDLRFECPGIDGAISVEIKVADEWSYQQLADALRDQLVEQYLRAPNANYGIYLLFHKSQKTHWVPDGQPGRDWTGLLEDLRVLADQLQEPRLELERLIVVGIDVS